jgi:hypothetical protein
MTFVETQGNLSAWPQQARFEPGPRAQPRLDLHRPGDGSRADIEEFIARVYRRHYAARLTQFMPVLASRGAGGTATAAAGYRSAAEPLFLECYLPQPIEAMLAAATGQRIAREQIVEVGQFASQCAGEGRRMMPALARHLVDQGFRWVVITATAELRRLFERQRLAVLPLAIAARRQVGDDAPLWGSYYRHAPRVLAGDLRLNLDRLEGGRG